HGEDAVELVGVDAEAESLSCARANAHAGAPYGPGASGHLGQRPEFLLSSSRRLPFMDNSVDLIVADPPWGARHANHVYVKNNLYSWAKEWSRVLKPGGVALVVTICSGHFERQVMSRLAKEGRLELEDCTQFDNKGWHQCRFYVARKPLQPRPAPAPPADPAEASQT
ncbi:unnamed protein product, partial [Polarella glacialis]